MRQFIILIVTTFFAVSAIVPAINTETISPSKTVPSSIKSKIATLNNSGLSLRLQLADDSSSQLPLYLFKPLQIPNSYWIQFNQLQNELVIIGADSTGLFFGIDHAERIVRSAKPHLLIGEILEVPHLRIRAIHIVVRNINKEELFSLIDLARAARLNTVVLMLSDGVHFNSEAFLPRGDAISKNDLLEVVYYIRANGMEFVPHVPLLSGQDNSGFGLKHPTLMYNSSTYDPANLKTMELVYSFLNELIMFARPKSIHIGHDELSGVWRNDLDTDERPLPATLFVNHVIELHKFLSSKGIETWIWGDMLLTPSDFPDMDEIHGHKDYETVLRRIPKSIVICDWHYQFEEKIFPSAKMFVDDGREVLGVTWKSHKNIARFSSYIQFLPKGGKGMMASTWFHVQRKEWDIVREIIQVSGAEFWKSSDALDTQRIENASNVLW